MEAYCVTFQKTWKVGGKRILRDNLWWSAIFWDSLTNNLPQCSFQANLPYLLLFWKFPECLLHCSTFLIVSLDWFVYMFISVTFLGALLGQGLCVCVCVFAFVFAGGGCRGARGTQQCCLFCDIIFMLQLTIPDGHYFKAILIFPRQRSFFGCICKQNLSKMW